MSMFLKTRQEYNCNTLCTEFQVRFESPEMGGAALRAAVTIVATVALSCLVCYLGEHLVSAIHGIALLTGTALSIYLLRNHEVTLQTLYDKIFGCFFK